MSQTSRVIFAEALCFTQSPVLPSCGKQAAVLLKQQRNSFCDSEFLLLLWNQLLIVRLIDGEGYVTGSRQCKGSTWVVFFLDVMPESEFQEQNIKYV